MSSSPLPDLTQTLQGRDLGFLLIIAQAWELDFQAPDAQTGIKRLVPLLLDRNFIVNSIQTMPGPAKSAFFDLVANEGRLHWALFIRRHGILREMGPAKRDRERPYAAPISAVETLWYCGLIGRSFLISPSGPAEFAYIPGDLLEIIAPFSGVSSRSLGKPASIRDYKCKIPAKDLILDDSCTLLAAGRLGLEINHHDLCQSELAAGSASYIKFLTILLTEAEMLDSTGRPESDKVRIFLGSDRGTALAALVQTWLVSKQINELGLIPGLSMEGEWHNEAVMTRRKILEFILQAPGQQTELETEKPAGNKSNSEFPGRPYINLISFIQAVKEKQPDFQRPAGDYDSWFIKDQENETFLRGFEHWDQIDGAILRYMICGPLHWLGLVDLAASEQDKSQILAFRLSSASGELLHGKTLVNVPVEDKVWLVGSDGRIRVPRLSPRKARYQLARYCQWDGFDNDVFLYQLTPQALQGAQSQGLQIDYLMKLLRSNSKGLPRPLVRGLTRWEKQGREAFFEKAIILRVKNPELLQTLRSGKAAKFLGDPLGPTAIIVNPGAVEKIKNILAEMGTLSESQLDD